MKFVEVVEGFSIRVDAIVSVKQGDGITLLIETEGREYTVHGDFKMFMHFITADDERKTQMEKMTTQFFGG